jgi:hypothetical protein
MPSLHIQTSHIAYMALVMTMHRARRQVRRSILLSMTCTSTFLQGRKWPSAVAVAG